VAVLEVTPDLADKLHITVPSDRAILADVEKYRTELIDTCRRAGCRGHGSVSYEYGARPPMC